MTQNVKKYNNLIDVCVKLENNPEEKITTQELFRQLLREYFFKEISEEYKNMDLFFKNFDIPEFLQDYSSIFDIDIDILENYINGSMINDSLAGKIMLSSQYLQAFYPHHASSFSQLPEDDKFELMDQIKGTNTEILESFKKMMLDRTADKKRKIITLIALIIKNIFLRSGAPLNKLSKPAGEIIKSIFQNTDQIFTASQTQTADLMDDKKIKNLIKTFFKIKQFTDIAEIADMYKNELKRYTIRTEDVLKS